jgi:hypothetical protein
MANPLSSFQNEHDLTSSAEGHGGVMSDEPFAVASLGVFQCPAPPKMRVDGQPMKKRGPKPRNEPPLNRKQELARRAQRSHRERKELYVKALEQELLQLKNDMSTLSSGYESLETENRQLKDNFYTVSNRNSALEEENNQLRQLLAQHSVSWSTSGSADALVGTAILEASTQIFNPATQQAEAASMSTALASVQESGQAPSVVNAEGGIDYEQLGINFVLGFEKPCLRHMRCSSDNNELYGHALMASCCPGVYPESVDDIPFESTIDSAPSQVECTLSKTSFASLLRHSERLNLDGEVTPVMVWQMIMEHTQLSEFTLEDFERIRQSLAGKVRCYGFGAVFEEFEVRDIIDSFILAKDMVVGDIIAAGIGQF